MNHYQQSVAIKASPASVYKVLTTPEGIKGWWTQDCEVGTKVGEPVQVNFDVAHKTFRIERLEPNREVAWHCTKAQINFDWLVHKDEWVGTEMIFRLSPTQDGHTQLNFEHRGLTPSLGCYEICNNGWQYFIASLQKFAETGAGTPHKCGDNCDHQLETGSL